MQELLLETFTAALLYQLAIEGMESGTTMRAMQQSLNNLHGYI